MFRWWPKKADRKREDERQAYLKRLWEVLDDCTKPPRRSHISQIAPPDASRVPVAE